MSEEKVASKQTVAEMDAEIKRLELEAKQLEVEEKKANLQDLRERLDERQLRREALRDRSRINAVTLEQNAQKEKKAQAICTHRKGGNGLPDFLAGRGQDPQYAVIKHVMLNGDTWVRCMRCGKTWKPPVKKNFYFNTKGEQVSPDKGTFSQAKYDEAMGEWREAVNFQTKNSTSSSYMFRYSDGGEYSREVLEATTLR